MTYIAPLSRLKLFEYKAILINTNQLVSVIILLVYLLALPATLSTDISFMEVGSP